jgi:hypothetical protein
LVAGQTIAVTQAATSACTYTVVPAATAVPSAGATVGVALTTGSTCGWTASSSASWLTVSAASGTGTAALTYTATPNTATTQRSATLTVAGQPFTITQAAAAAPCTYSVVPAATAVPDAGATVDVALTTGSTCGWIASSDASWLTVSAASGTGTAAFTYTATPNTATTQRSATLTVAGQGFTITQAAMPTSCTYTLAATSYTWGPGSGETVDIMTTGSGCAWTALSSTSWLMIKSPKSGTGSGSIVIWRPKNNTKRQRKGTLMIAGQAVTITQLP